MQPSSVVRCSNQFRQGRLSGLVAQHRKRKARAGGAALETQSAGVNLTDFRATPAVRLAADSAADYRQVVHGVLERESSLA